MGVAFDFFLAYLFPLLPWLRRSPEDTPPVDVEAGLLGTPPQVVPDHPTSEQELASRLDLHAAGTNLAAGRLQIELQQANQTLSREAERQLAIRSGTDRLLFREAERRTDQRSNLKLKEHLRLSFLVITIATGVLVNLFVVRTGTEPISKSPSLIVASASALVSLVSGSGFMIDTMSQMRGRRNQGQNNPPRSWYKLLLCLCLMSLAFTVLALVASFLPKTYYYLPVVLLPALPMVGIAFHDVCWRDDGHVLPGGNADPHKADRKRSVELTISMTTFSFMGALGSAIGYQKNSSNRVNHIYIKISIYFMIGAAVTGLVTLLINGLLRGRDWKKIALGNIIMLCLLVSSVLIVASTFLGGVLAGTIFPVVIAVLIWYFMEFHVPWDNNGDLNAALTVEKDLKPLYTVALTATSVSFGAVMTVFSGFLGGGEGKGKTLEVTIFAVVSCFLSAVSLGMLTFRVPKKASIGAAAWALFCLTIVLIVLAALAVVSYVG